MLSALGMVLSHHIRPHTEMPSFVSTAISDNRFEPYLKEAGFDRDRALKLYMWNMNISASFFPLLGSVEIAIRNMVLHRVENIYSAIWWQNASFHADLGNRGKGIVLRAEGEINKRGITLNSGRMTAELTFGFWQNMFLPKYETNLWPSLCGHFCDLPINVNLAELFAKTRQIKDLRNRIFHHEPIFSSDISQSFANAMTVLTWMNRANAEWLKPQLSTLRLLREKP